MWYKSWTNIHVFVFYKHTLKIMLVLFYDFTFGFYLNFPGSEYLRPIKT